jgi:hypothetical protein
MALPLSRFAATRVNDDSGEVLPYMTTVIASLWVGHSELTCIRRKVADDRWVTTRVTPLHQLCGSAAGCCHTSQRRQWQAPSVYNGVNRIRVRDGGRTHLLAKTDKNGRTHLLARYTTSGGGRPSVRRSGRRASGRGLSARGPRDEHHKGLRQPELQEASLPTLVPPTVPGAEEMPQENTPLALFLEFSAGAEDLVFVGRGSGKTFSGGHRR